MRRITTTMLSIVLTTAIVTIAVILHFKEVNKPINYVVYSRYYNEEMHKALLERLQANQISYLVDEDRNVLIPKNNVESAVQCCS